MIWILLIAVAVIVAMLFIATKPGASKGAGVQLPYARNEFLFSPAERSFLGVLVQAVGENYTVYGKVRVADVVSVKAMANRSSWRRAFNRISAKHFDFVVCDKGDLAIICAIELDDKSHQQRKRQERDAFLVGVCRAASLPFIQVPAQRTYSVSELQLKFFDALGKRQVPELKQFATESSLVQPSAVDTTWTSTNPIPQQSIQVAIEPELPVCPKCAAPMSHREVKSGSKAGQKFWGCSTFPKCRGITLSN